MSLAINFSSIVWPINNMSSKLTIISIFRRRNTETGTLSKFVKILGAGPSPKQRQETRKASLTKETAQIFWMQDLIELKSMHLLNPVCTCNLPSLDCFEGSASLPS